MVLISIRKREKHDIDPEKNKEYHRLYQKQYYHIKYAGNKEYLEKTIKHRRNYYKKKLKFNRENTKYLKIFRCILNNIDEFKF